MCLSGGLRLHRLAQALLSTSAVVGAAERIAAGLILMAHYHFAFADLPVVVSLFSMRVADCRPILSWRLCVHLPVILDRTMTQQAVRLGVVGAGQLRDDNGGKSPRLVFPCINRSGPGFLTNKAPAVASSLDADYEDWDLLNIHRPG